jgi:hypothetical protein
MVELEQVLENAKNKPRITKEITFHGLLEKGVDVKYIQELLGHFNIKTTQRYLHVRKEQLVVFWKNLFLFLHRSDFGVYSGETDHMIPWQTDQRFNWRTEVVNAVEVLSKVVV